MASFRALRSPLVTSALALAATLASSPAHAQALHRFEDAHRTKSAGSSSSRASSSSSSSSSSSPSDASSCDTSSSDDDGVGAAVVRAVAYGIARGIYALGSVAVDATRDVPPATVDETPRSFPAAVVYAGDRESAYTMPWRRDPDGVLQHDEAPIRRGELGASGFLALNEQVYAHDMQVSGWLGLFVAQASWERFYEPRADLGTVDTLDLFRLRMGPNILGPHFKSVELYTLFGMSGLHGQDGLTPAFDLAVEGRVYPVRPFALLASSSISFFGEGPPLVDARLEMGVSVGRFDFRGGMRFLSQDPAQSFAGPVASIALRL